MPYGPPIGADLQNLWSTCQWECAGMPASLLKRWRAVDGYLMEAAQTWGLPVTLLTAIAWTESKFKVRAKSGAGAQGLMQFMPATGRAAAKALASKGILSSAEDWDPYNPEHSAQAAGWYMRRLLQRWNGRLDLALASYNAGSGRIAERGENPANWPTQTQRYVPAVLRRIEAMEAILRNCARVRSHYDALGPLHVETQPCSVPGLEPIPGVSGGKRPGTAPLPRPRPSPSPWPSPPSPAPAQAGAGLGFLALILLAAFALGGLDG